MKRFVTYIVLPFVTLAQSDVDTQQMYKFIVDICIPVKRLYRNTSGIIMTGLPTVYDAVDFS